MPEQMRKFIILISAIAVVLVLIVMFCTSKSKVRKIISMFLQDDTLQYKESSGESERRNKKPQQEKPRKSSQPQIEMATLVQKSDDRRRIIESTGQTRIEDELYELVFKTRKGRTIILECSRNAYNKIPFNQQGSLTYKKERLIKFKYFGGIIHNDE